MFGKPDTRKVFGNREAHQVTPRFMQRLWAQVFAQCPKMEWDPESKGWKVGWGEHEMHGISRSDDFKSTLDRSRNEKPAR